MQFYSTEGISPRVQLKEAVLNSLPSDRGLYMPEQIRPLDPAVLRDIGQLSFADLSYEVARTLLAGTISEDALQDIIHDAINFPAPVVRLDDQLHCLELFHGPSLAFKDFGARFMSRTMNKLIEGQNRKLHILVATSGDTGGAVAMGFYKTPNIEVTILYPSGKVSLLQEKQLTTLGENISAIEVDGTFDDCQRMVKSAFLDADCNQHLMLSSANSINIARLIPQSFYYFEAYRQLAGQLRKEKDIYFCTPSGNFGNITAGLLAKRMGLPVKRFIAANNANNVVKRYLESGEYDPKESIATYSNAMDVGAPSNFVRMLDIYGKDVDAMRKDIAAYSYNDAETVAGIQEAKEKYNYVLCPHTSIAYLGMRDYLKSIGDTNGLGVFLGTAHPAKFIDIVEESTGEKVQVPEALEVLRNREKKAVQMDTSFDSFKEYLLGLSA